MAAFHKLKVRPYILLKITHTFGKCLKDIELKPVWRLALIVSEGVIQDAKDEEQLVVPTCHKVDETKKGPEKYPIWNNSGIFILMGTQDCLIRMNAH